ncbi:hypothetical protein MMC08_004520 [Hypocenomyce scalaris]|nr:hypothetical protein [Hypocenomyce scalaris]
MCFNNSLKGEIPDDPTHQPIRVASIDSINQDANPTARDHTRDSKAKPNVDKQDERLDNGPRTFFGKPRGRTDERKWSPEERRTGQGSASPFVTMTGQQSGMSTGAG